MIVAADESLAGPLPKTGTSQVFVESEFTGLAIVEFFLPFVGSFFFFFFFFLSFETRFSPSSSGVFCAKRSDSASFLEYQRDRTNNKTSKSNWMEFRGKKNQQEELVINSAT